MSGFTPIGTMDGSDYHGKLAVVLFSASDTVPAFQGDMVIEDLTNPAAANKYPPVTQAVGTEGTPSLPAVLLGAIAEFYPDFTDEGSLITNFRAASTARQARITRGTAVIYAVAADNLVSIIDGLDIGDTLDMIQPASPSGDIVTGISGQVLDSSDVATGDQFLIQGFNELKGDTQGTPSDAAVGTQQVWNVTIANGVGAILRGG